MKLLLKLIITLITTYWLFLNTSTASFFMVGFALFLALSILLIGDVYYSYKNRTSIEKNRAYLAKFLAYKHGRTHA
ncbi:hypothetical protein J5U18_08720 [Sphingobacteriaceae bacterium WQ 2009]|uniref:Uncharacterized protein n=1 Tax=Rhinopithecimicrobium faecis TaxID=2820698 RepID=A0A8T4H9C7_9SPHI|nr:hypothetical protein [Sphingobacteriaceae bacterium WQ 2009]